jgi:hypothetical protein
MNLRLIALVLIATVAFRLTTPAHPAGQEMANAANNFLTSLDDKQKSKAQYKFEDGERFNWHFIPKPRNGLPFKEMTPSQRALAQVLLGSALSHQGFAKAETIMSLEQILYDVEGRGTRAGSPTRDAELYYFTIFGQPGSSPWGWRVEGHHLSLNFVVDKENVLAVTPSFMGSNPGRVMDGPRKGLRVLGREEDLARDFLHSLDDSQRAQAIITNVAPREIITGNSRNAKSLEPLGLSCRKLKKDQLAKLHALMQEFVGRYRPDLRDAFTSALSSSNGLKSMSFAWAGGTEPGQGHYYRIQSPRFLIEYDNTQNNANHIHTACRDLQNDFGDDVLKRHYEQSH